MRISLIIAAGAALLSATTASAEDSRAGQVVEQVRFHDLDLATAAGVAILNRRIGAATEAVCGSYAGTDTVEQDRIGECRNSVRQSAAPQIAKAIQASGKRFVGY